MTHPPILDSPGKVEERCVPLHFLTLSNDKVVAMAGRIAIAIVVLLLPSSIRAAAEIDVGTILKEAEETAEMLRTDRTAILFDLAVAQAKHGDRQESKRLMKRTIKLSMEVRSTDEETKAREDLFLKRVSFAQAELGDSAGALKTAQLISKTGYVAWAQSDIAWSQAQAGDFKGALATCDRINPEAGSFKADALHKVAWAEAEAGQFDASFQTVKLIEAVLAKDDDTRGTEKGSDKVPGTFLTFDDTRKTNRSLRNDALDIIAKEQAKRGKMKEARSTLQGDVRETVRVRTLLDIAKIQAERGDKPGAMETCREVLRLAERLNDVNCFWRLAETQAAVGDISGALKTITKFPKDTDKAYMLLLISIAAMKTGERSAAAKSFEEGLAVAKTGELESKNLEYVANKLAQARDCDRAINIADVIRSASTKSLALRKIVFEVLKQHDIPRALKIADSIKDQSYDRALALGAVGATQAKAKLPAAAQTLERALEAAKLIEIGGGTDVIALYELGLTQVQAGYVDVAAKTFDEARRRALQYKEATYAAALFQDIARAQAGGGDPRGALACARSQSSQLFKALSLAGVIQGLIEGPEKSDP
jgi:tetratricopeptide (TPR) repeat protein